MERLKQTALIKAGVGISIKDKKKAMAGMDEFIRLSLLDCIAEEMPDPDDYEYEDSEDTQH